MYTAYDIVTLFEWSWWPCSTQPHHQARLLWANNLHILNQAIKEMSIKKNQTDSRSTTFGKQLARNRIRWRRFFDALCP